jgi:tetratricopeptide (TPR) repeat protein
MSEKAEVIQNYLRILEAVPTNVPAFEALKKIFNEEEQWTELAQLYENRAGNVGQDQAPSLFLQAAALRLHKLQDPASAVKSIQKLLQLDPNNGQALALWRQISLKSGDYPTAIKILRQESQLSDDNGRKAAIFIDIAQIFEEHLSNPKNAAVAYHQAFILNPGEIEAMEQALRLYRVVEEWPRVIAVLRARMESGDLEDTERARHLSSMAQVLLRHTDEGQSEEGRQKIKKLFEEAVSLDSELQEAKEAIEELDFEFEDWNTLFRRLKKELRKADPDRQVFLNYKIAEGYYKRESRPAFAIRYCKQALDLNPEYTKAQDLLIELYTEMKRWPALSEFFQDQAGRTEESAQKIYWLKKLVNLYNEQTKELDREIEIHERILEIAPGEEASLERLEQVYRQERLFSKALSVMEKRLRIEENDEDKKELLLEMASLAENELRNTLQTIDYLEQGFDLDNTDMEVLGRLLPLLETERQWEKLIEGFTTKLEFSEDKIERGSLYSRIGEIHNLQLSQPSEAFEAYKQALRENPQDNDLIQKLEALAKQIGNWDAMIELYETTLDQTEDAGDQAALYFRIGNIFEREMDDRERARGAYEDARGCAPHLGALLALEALYRNGKLWEELSDLLNDKAQSEELEEDIRIEALEERARIMMGVLGDREGAAATFEDVLKIRESHTPALDALERIYKQTQNWDALKNIYQLRAEISDDEAVQIQTRHMLGQLLVEELDAPEEAVQVYQQLRYLAPKDSRVLAQLDELFRQLARWEEWVETAFERVQNLRKTDQKKDILFEIARIQEEELEDAEGAIETLRDILNLDENEMKALDILERLLDEKEDLEGQLVVLRKKVQLSPKDNRLDLLYQMASLHEALEQEDAMASVYREVLDIAPQELPALRALQSYHEGRGELNDVLDLMQRERDITDGEERVTLGLSIAQLEMQLGQYGKAIREFSVILSDNPEDETARASLEEIASEHPAWSNDALAELEPIYRKTNSWDALARALEIRFETLSPRDRRPRLQVAQELEEIHRVRLFDDQKAFDWLSILLREDFSDQEVRERAEIMAEELGRWADLLQTYEGIVRSFVNTDKIVETYLFIALKYQDELNDAENAIRNYKRVLDYDSVNRQAIDALDEIYREVEEWRELVDILRLQIRLTEEVEEKKELLFEVAQLWDERLSDPPEAIQVLNQLLEIEPDNLDAIRKLAALYRKEQHFQDLADLWEKELTLLEEGDEKTSLSFSLAEVYAFQLQKQTRALELFQEVLEAVPDHEDAIQRVEMLMEEDEYRLTCARILEPIYLEQQNYDLLKAVYKIQLEDVTQSVVERRKAVMRLGQLHEEKLAEARDSEQDRLAEFRQAFERYLQVFKEEPGHPGCRQALYRMAEKIDTWRELALAYEGGVSQIPEVEDRIATHLVLAQVYRDRLSEPDQGMIHDRTIVDDLDPRNLEAIEALETYYSEREDWTRLIEILFQKVDALDDEAERKEVFDQIARIYEIELQNNGEAIKIFQQYLVRLDRADEGESPAERGLREAQEAAEAATARVEELFDTVDNVRAELEELEGKVEEHRAQLEEALAELEEPEEGEEVEETEAIASLRMLADSTEGARDAKAAQLEALLEETDTAEEADADASDAVKKAEEELEAYNEANRERQDQRTAFQLDAVRELSRLFEVEQRWEELVESLEQEADILDDTDAVLQLRFRVAQLWDNQLENKPRAIELYRAILDIEAQFEPALDRLEELVEDEDYQLMVAQSLESYFRDGSDDWPRLIEMIEIQLNHTEEKGKRLDFLKEIVELYETELDNPDMAFVYLCRAFREVPTDRDVIQDLERLAEENDAWEELVGVYEDEVEDIGDDQLALRMYLKIASIYDEALQDPIESIDNYQSALGIDAYNSAALGALDRLYRQEKNWEQLVDILNRKVKVTEDEREQTSLWLRIAKIWERELEVATEAIQAYRSILGIDGNNLNALNSLQRLYEDNEQWEELYGVCELKVGLVDSASEQTFLFKKMASLNAGPLSRPEQAIASYEQVIDNNPNDEEALVALQSLYSAAERWDEQVQVVERLLTIVTGVEQKKTYYRTLGEVYGEKLNDAEQAIDGWTHVLDLDPKNDDALRALRALYLLSESWEALVDILRRMIPLQSEQDDVLQLYLQLASIYQERMERIDDAIAAWRRVLELDSTHEQALQTLETLLVGKEDWRGVIEVLAMQEAVVEELGDKIALLLRCANISHENLNDSNRSTPYYERVLELDNAHLGTINALVGIYRQNQDWKNLIEVYGKEIPLLEESSERVGRHREIAEIYENKLFNSTEAFDAYVQAFETEPSDEDIRTELERLAEEMARWDGLVEIFVAKSQTLESVEVQASLLLQIGRIYQQELNRDEEAIEAFVGALGLAPGNLEALDALEELYESNLHWESLIGIYEAKYELNEDLYERKDLLFRVAELWERELGNLDSAVATYRKLQAIDPEDVDVLLFLDRLFRRQENWTDLVEVLERRIQHSSDPDEILELRLDLGQTYSLELDDEEKAVEAYGFVLQADENNIAALQGLARLYTQMERWNDLLDILRREESLTDREDDQIPLFYRMAIVYEEELAQPADAIVCLNEILELDRWNLAAINGLETLYRMTAQWQELIETHEQHIRAVDDLEEMAVLYYKIGSIYEEHLEDEQRAVTFYQRVLDADPYYQPALSSLGKLYEKNENWSKCIEMMEREARVVNEPEQLVDVYTRIGKLYEERLVQIDRAKDSYRQALDIQPGYLPALRSLKVIHFMQKDWENVIKLSQQQEAFTEDSGEKAELYCEIAKLYREKLHEPDNASSYYEQALQLAPDKLYAARPLADLYMEERNWERAEVILSHLLNVMQTLGDTEELYRYHQLLAYSAEKQEKVDLALHHYQESYNLNTEYYPTLKGLGQIYYMQEKWEQSRKVYQLVLSQHSGELTERELSEVYFCMGRAYDQMDSLERAVEYYERALQIDPANPMALRRLAVHAEANEQWDNVHELKERLLLILDDEQERFQINIELGDLCYERLGKPHQAASNYRQAYRINPNDTQILFRLIEIYEVTRQWNEMISCLEQLVELQSEPSEKIKYIVQIAEMYQQQLNDVTNAVVFYNKALDINPAYLEAFVALETLLSQHEKWQLLDENYRGMLARLPQDESQREMKIMLWKRLGDLHSQKLNNLEHAITAYEWVYNLDTSLANLEALADLYGRSEQYREKGVEAHHKLLDLNPGRIESYKSLIRAYYELNQYDRSFTVCSTLRFLGKATPEEEEFYKSMKAKAPERIKQQFREEEIWQGVLSHDSVKSELAQILAILYTTTGKGFAKAPKQYGIKRNSKVDPNLFFSKTYQYVAQVLGLSGREVFQSTNVVGLKLANTAPPVIAAGADMFKERHPKELMFMIGRQLAASRPEFLFASVLSYAEYSMLLASFFNMLEPSYPLNCPPETAENLKKRFAKLIPAPQRNQLVQLTQAYLQNPNRVSPDQYLIGMEHTLNRVGFCIANDLGIAASVCERDGREDFDIPAQERIKELVTFSTSREYFAFREAMGLAVSL